MSTNGQPYVYCSCNLSQAWHIALRDDLTQSLCGRSLNAHGAPGWPRIVETPDRLYGEYPAVCGTCNDARPLLPHERIRVGVVVRRRNQRERQNVGTVVAVLPPTSRLPASAKVRWAYGTRRLNGTTQTTSTIQLDRLAIVEEVAP